MSPTSPLVQIAGTPLARAAANHAFHRFARRRTARLAHADPVAVQERTLRRLALSDR